MRLIVIGALVVAALAIALLLQVTSHSEPASAARSAAVAQPPSTPPPASAEPTATPPPVEEHARPMRPTHGAPASALAPSLPTPPAETVKPKHIDTPTDILRWSLMRAVRNSEPGVIDCLDKAKAAGTVAEGRAVFVFFVATKNAKAVISRASVETSPFPDALNTCIVGTLAAGELDQELPEGQNEFRVQRELVVDKGAITQYKLKSFLAP
jgi:hypothetical protein